MLSPWDITKYAVFSASQQLGVNRLLRTWRRRQLLVVLYHGVISAPKDPLGYAVQVKEFDKQIAFLSRYFRPISLADVIAAVKGEHSLPDRAVLVTFDDGYRNNLTNAAPILRRHGVPAVIYVVTGYVGTDRILWVEEIRLRVLHWPRPDVPMPAGQPHRPLPISSSERAQLAQQISEMCKRLPESEKEAYLDRLRELPVFYGDDYVEEAFAFLSWEEVRQLQAQGFEIGSHTVDHPILSALRPEAVTREMVESKQTIEDQLGSECLSFAYPNGGKKDVSDAVIESARKAGYKVAFLGMDRFNRHIDSAFTLTRVNMLGYLPPCVFHSRVSGLVEH